jgi:hypothetical protein
MNTYIDMDNAVKGLMVYGGFIGGTFYLLIKGLAIG